MSRIVVGIDPGKLSGFVVVEAHDDGTANMVMSGEYEQIETCRTLEHLLYSYKSHEAYVQRAHIPISVVIEDFIINLETAKKKETRYSLEVIGCARYLANKYDVEFVVQTPVDAKNFSTNERLKALNIYPSGGEGHQKDAARHVVLYLVRKGWKPKGLLSE